MSFLKKRKPAAVRNDAPALPPKLSRLLHLATGLALTLGVLLLVAALASYSPDDNAWSHSADLPYTHNWMGAPGAWLSDILLFVFGLSAWWLPLYAALMVWFGQRDDERFSPELLSWAGLAVYGGFTVLLLSSSAFEAIRLYSLDVALPLSAGGIVGDMLGKTLHRALGFNGASLLLMIAMLVGFSAFTHVSWLNLMEAIGAGVEYLALAVRRLWQRSLGEEILDTPHAGSPASQAPAAEVASEPVADSPAEEAPAAPLASGSRIEPRLGDEPALADEHPAQADIAAQADSPADHDAATASAASHEPPVLVLDSEDEAIPAADAPAPSLPAAQPSTVPAQPPRRHGPPRLLLPSAPLPPDTLLQRLPPDAATDEETVDKARVEQALLALGVPATVLSAHVGPVVIRYEFEAGDAIAPERRATLARELTQALAVDSLRLLDSVPGKSCMALEHPRRQRQPVLLSVALRSPAWRNSPSRLTLALGVDSSGQPMTADLARMPHVLLAGAPRSGKTTALHAMLLSLLYKATPEEARLLLIDPEHSLAAYRELPHLLAPVISDMQQAALALGWCMSEMERRYQLMARLGVRNLASYNQKLREADSRDERIADPFSEPDDLKPLELMPAIVVVVNELAELMAQGGKQVEERLARLAQKARAAGIHLVLATGRASAEVITGLIKANIPTRMAFQVASKVDSRLILEQMGAETLLGQGDMLYKPPGSDYALRVHGADVSPADISQVTEFVRRTGKPDYVDGLLEGAPSVGLPRPHRVADPSEVALDPLYDDAVARVRQLDKATVMLLQSEFNIGATRAIRLLDSLELTGVISAADANGHRKVLAVSL